MRMGHASFESDPYPALARQANRGSVLAKLWAAVLISVVAYFTVTCIEHVALERALQEAGANKLTTPRPERRRSGIMHLD